MASFYFLSLTFDTFTFRPFFPRMFSISFFRQFLKYITFSLSASYINKYIRLFYSIFFMKMYNRNICINWFNYLYYNKNQWHTRYNYKIEIFLSIHTKCMLVCVYWFSMRFFIFLFYLMKIIFKFLVGGWIGFFT